MLNNCLVELERFQFIRLMIIFPLYHISFCICVLAFPSLEIFLYLLDKTFPDTGPDLGSWSVYGAVFEWRGLLFTASLRFYSFSLTVSYFSVGLIISRHDT